MGIQWHQWLAMHATEINFGQPDGLTNGTNAIAIDEGEIGVLCNGQSSGIPEVLLDGVDTKY